MNKKKPCVAGDCLAGDVVVVNDVLHMQFGLGLALYSDIQC